MVPLSAPLLLQQDRDRGQDQERARGAPDPWLAQLPCLPRQAIPPEQVATNVMLQARVCASASSLPSWSTLYKAGCIA